jgi:hypothetical protein
MADQPRSADAINGTPGQGSWNNQAVYYRCMFLTEYAAQTKINHPRSVYLRENTLPNPSMSGWPACSGPTPRQIAAHMTSAASMAGTSGGAGWPNAQAGLASSTCIHKPPQSWSQISLGGGWSENLYRPCQPAMERSVPEANHEQPDTLPSTRIAVTALGCQ